MLAWICENAGSIGVIACLMILVASIVHSLIRNRKNGRASCGGNCAHCKGCH